MARSDGGLGHRRCTHRFVAIVLTLAVAVAACADQPAVTVLADFEDASVAARIGVVRNVLAGDCAASRAAIPAHGQGSLALEIGATAPSVSVVCDLTFREPTRFHQADHVTTFCWINEGQIEIAFRILDARDQLFETRAETVRLHHRWVRVAADLDTKALTRLHGQTQLTYPIQIQGYRLTTARRGKQITYLDELQVEHRVRPQNLIHGEFRFDEPTRIYEPNSSVYAAVIFENRSREKPLALSVDLAWMRPDGSVLETQRANVRLLASGVDFRSHRTLDFSQRIRQPGLYRLVARARASGWTSRYRIETTIAVTRSNRRVSRGRSTFFAVRTNLLREPELDQDLEIDVARDIGINLLAIDAPWQRVQSKSDTLNFDALDPVIEALSRQNMGAMVVLTDPPPWLPSGTAARTTSLAKLATTISSHFGGRLSLIQLGQSLFPDTDFADQLEIAREVRQRVQQIRPDIEVLPPPIPVEDLSLAATAASFAVQNPAVPLVFLTRGDTSAALATLENFRQRAALDWRDTHWWAHEADPLVGSGHFANAESILRHYTHAALAGVQGLLWFDLRDDDSDVSHREMLRGLVRRDFGPKTSMLGYATAAGLLTGFRCAGPVAGTPDGFDSAMFLGADRQIAVLLPHPNRVRPAALSPARSVRGEFSVQDFERRTRPVLTSRARPLVSTTSRPLFVTLAINEADPDPQVRFVQPWLRVPATVFCGDERGFTIEVDAVIPLRRSYLQLRLPRDSPVTSSFSATALRVDKGETVTQEVQLTPKDGATFEHAEATVRLSLEGSMLELPITIKPIVSIGRLPSDKSSDNLAFGIATLAAAEGQRATAEGSLHCAYEPQTLHITAIIEDDRVVPVKSDSSSGSTGDQLIIGIARESSDRHLEIRVNVAQGRPRVDPIHGTPAGAVAGWRCETRSGKDAERRIYHLSIPSESLGQHPFSPGDRLLLAVRYVDDDDDGFPPVPLSWGRGLDGSRSSENFRWLTLSP